MFTQADLDILREEARYKLNVMRAARGAERSVAIKDLVETMYALDFVEQAVNGPKSRPADRDPD